MSGASKILPEHLSRRAYIYVRQSSPGQVAQNPESARRQRDLVQRAAGLGWPSSRIEVLEGDQGKTGQSAAAREAFKRIVADVSVGEIGLVMGLEVSRLARNNADWFPLLEICGLTKTLIADEEGLYDPNDPNDRLVLGLKGTMSEAELQVLRGRLHGARWSMARRGELRRRVPVGYVWERGTRVAMDPDERVRTALGAFFRRFEEEGSAYGVARAYEREGLLFPRKPFRGRWDGALRWEPLGVREANALLHNPFYAGAYFYGSRRAVTLLDPETKGRRTVTRRVPWGRWEVLIHDAHPAYISWDEFLRNQGRLRENWSLRHGGTGVARSGSALLQGLAYCGQCARRMIVRYTGRKPYPMYLCNRHAKTGAWTYCTAVPSAGVDRWVEERVLETIRPVGIEAAFAAVEELERRGEDLRRQWEQRIEQAQYEANFARRRYEAVDPDNRLVAGTLERDWEERLRAVEEARREFDRRAVEPPMRISEEERARVRALARDLPRLWRAKTTKISDRKKVLRILLREVWLSQEEEPRRTRVRLHWQSGAITEGDVERPLPVGLRFKTPESVRARMRDLKASGESPEAIADRLNREGMRTGRGNPFTPGRVRGLLQAWKGQISERERLVADRESPMQVPPTQGDGKDG
jgi:DNA invertase Pin-like site-specific DNA recombinase